MTLDGDNGKCSKGQSMRYIEISQCLNLSLSPPKIM